MNEQTTPASVLVFGLRVKHLRKTQRWTQARLGAEMSLRGHPWHGPTVSKSESGERVPSLTELLDLADIFEVDPTLLYDASPNARPDVAATLDEVRLTAAQVEADGSRLETLILEMLRQHRGTVDRLMRSVDRVEDLLGPGPTGLEVSVTPDPLVDPSQRGADPLAAFTDDPLTEPHNPQEGWHGHIR